MALSRFEKDVVKITGQIVLEFLELLINIKHFYNENNDSFKLHTILLVGLGVASCIFVLIIWGAWKCKRKSDLKQRKSLFPQEECQAEESKSSKYFCIIDVI